MSSPTPRAAVPVAPPKAARRVKPWMILLGISIGWKVLVFTLGAAVPRWVIGDGLDLVPLASRVYAEQAKVTALSLWDHPLERFGLVQALRVIRIDNATPLKADSLASGKAPHGSASAPATTGASAAPAGCHGRTATVRAYTYFAIPYSEARTVCDTGVVEYRVFRRRS